MAHLHRTGGNQPLVVMLSFGVFGVLNKTIGDFGVAEAFTFTVNVFIQKLGVGKLYTEKILQYDYI